MCEVVYAYSPTSGGSRTFRSGIAGPSPPHPMPHRASYRIMTREVLLKGLKDSGLHILYRSICLDQKLISSRGFLLVHPGGKYLFKLLISILTREHK